MEDIFEMMEKLHQEMDQSFKRLFQQSIGASNALIPAEKGAYRNPRCDLCETESGVLAAVEVPGVDKQDIDLQVTEDSIEVRAQKKQEKESRDKGSYQFASQQTIFYRRIPLPVKVRSEQAKASYKNGVLTIEVPKVKQLEKKKRVEIG